MNQQHPFKWRHFESEIILLYVRWYLRYALSYRDLEELMRERGLQVDHTTIYRWFQHYAPELEKRSRPHLKATTDSWRVDETYIKIKKTWTYLYRAVDSEGNTLEFLLSATQDAEAAERFFVKALRSCASSALQGRPVQEQVAQPTAADPNPTSLSGGDLLDGSASQEAGGASAGVLRAAASQAAPANIAPKNLPVKDLTPSAPRVINVDKNAAYPKAVAALKAAGALPEHVELRQVKYLNNLVEQDHRFIKRLVKPGMGFFSFETARRTLQGYEVMHMLRKGQMQGVAKGDITGQIAFIARLFEVAA